MMLYHSVGNYGVCLQIGYGTQNFAPRPKDQSCARLGKAPQAELGKTWHIPHKGCISMKVPKYDLIPNDGIFESV